MQWIAETLSTLTSDDVVWLLAFRKASPLIEEIRRIAADKGARTLALTVLLRMRIDPAPDHQISVSRGEAGQSQSLVVPMTIANTVILDLAAIEEGQSLRALSAFRSFRSVSGLSPSLL